VVGTMKGLIGKKVDFYRKNIKLSGTIEKVLNNSVIVSISKDYAAQLELETPYTVVGHKNYVVKLIHDQV
jgi:uncharacterized protein YkvS